jgi:molybdenum cofactor cytidylyltransferase
MRPGHKVIAAVVLAAGASTRLGEPKQLVTLAGETLLERAVRVAHEAGLSPVIAVVHDAALIEPLKARGAEVLLNRRYSLGMSTSIQSGLKWAQAKDVAGVVLMTCDQPAVTADHLRALAVSGAITASAYAGRRGVPAYFPASSFPQLLQLTGDTGARALLRDAPTIDLPHGELDIDTADDLAQARKLFG